MRLKRYADDADSAQLQKISSLLSKGSGIVIQHLVHVPPLSKINTLMEYIDDATNALRAYGEAVKQLQFMNIMEKEKTPFLRCRIEEGVVISLNVLQSVVPRFEVVYFRGSGTVKLYAGLDYAKAVYVFENKIALYHYECSKEGEDSDAP